MTITGGSVGGVQRRSTPEGRGLAPLDPSHPSSFHSLIAVAVVATLLCLLGRLALGWLSSGIMNRVSLQFVRTLTDSAAAKVTPSRSSMSWA